MWLICSLVNLMTAADNGFYGKQSILQQLLWKLIILTMAAMTTNLFDSTVM